MRRRILLEPPIARFFVVTRLRMTFCFSFEQGQRQTHKLVVPIQFPIFWRYTMVYPLKLSPIYKQYLWGGENLTTLGKPLPFSQVGESWELSEHPSALSTIDNGLLKGKTITEAKTLWQEQLLGRYYAHSVCPLLTKFLDATEQLSIQVHPQPEKGGKGEVWYIISAQPDAKIIYGIKKGVGKEEIIPLLNTPQLAEVFCYIPVKTGDVFYIPPGVVHSLGKGIVAAEIQQQSDITYRLYDFNRRDKAGNLRPLHIKEALTHIDWEKNQQPETKILWQTKQPAACQTIYETRPSFYFSTLSVQDQLEQTTSRERFTVLICPAGAGELYWRQECLPIKKGDTILIPAYLGSYSIKNQQAETPLVLLEAAPI